MTLVFAREKTLGSLHEALLERRTAVWFNNTLIGRSEWLEPLIKASLNIRSLGYKPDRRKFSIQDRPDTSLLDIEIANASDANFILRNASAYKIATEGNVFIVPPHSAIKLTVLTLKRIPETALSFEVLNATNAPGQHPTVKWTVRSE